VASDFLGALTEGDNRTDCPHSTSRIPSTCLDNPESIDDQKIGRPRNFIAASKAHMVEASPRLVEILRSTLARVEQSADLSPDDPALVKLRDFVLHLIAELEVAKTRKAA
jgi:hypothetical protein